MEIVTRSEWGARAPKYQKAIPLPSPDLWLHHSAPPSGSDHRGATGVRAIQNYHMDSRGWSDIAYSFIVDRVSGVVYEGRGAGIQGGHTRGHNRTSHAICVMGHFDREKPSPILLDSLSRLVAYGHGQGWWANPALSGGHRDTGAATSCPGEFLYREIPTINEGATMALSKAEEDYLRDQIKQVADLGSNGGWVTSTINHLRKHPGSSPPPVEIDVDELLDQLMPKIVERLEASTTIREA